MDPKNSHTMMLNAYRCLGFVVFPPLLLSLMLLNVHRKERLRHIIRRCGLGQKRYQVKGQGKKGPEIWVHALSFGEVRAAMPLLYAIRKRWPRAILIASSSTITGLTELKKRAGEMVDQVVPLPYDFTPCIQRIIGPFSPQCVVLVETDVWPNLLWRFKERGAKIVFANGSISTRAQRRLSRARWMAQLIYSPFDYICMQSERDLERLERLGLGATQMSVYGSLKFDALPLVHRDEMASSTKRELGLEEDDKINCVFGSLHKGEEGCLLRCVDHLKAKGLWGQFRFIVAPRYTEISDYLRDRLAAAGIKVLLRSEMGESEERNRLNDFDCIIVDTLGELIRFYSIGHIAVLGGTFVPVGGHNVLEPASLGLPIIVGPHIESIEDTCFDLEKEGALIHLEGTEGLPNAISSLIESPGTRQIMGKRAMDYVRQKRGVSQRYIALLEDILGDYRV